MVKKTVVVLALCSPMLVCSLAGAEPLKTTVAQTGWTGVLRTPHADTLPFGDVTLNYNTEDNVDYTTSSRAHDTLLMGFGLFPYTEFVAQLTYYDFDACDGLCDLSVAGKVGFDWLIPKEWFQLALGGSDLGGQAVRHRAYYAVASKQVAQFRFSLGYGDNDAKTNHQMGNHYLSGVFGGVEYQPFSWLQLVSDYDGTGANAGLKLFTPEDWLPLGSTAHLTLQAYSDSDTPTRDNKWLGLGLTLPLAGPNFASRYNRGSESRPGVDITQPTAVEQAADAEISESAVALESAKATQAASTSNERVSEPTLASGSPQQLKVLQGKLVEYGFENVSVGSVNQTVLVKAENNLFNRNELDAIGVILGLIRDNTDFAQFSFALLNNNIPVIYISGSQEDLQSVFAPQSSAQSPRLRISETSRDFDDVRWVNERENSHVFKPKIILSPSLYSTLGTEFGAFDYSLALSTNLQVPVWTGGLVDIRHMLPISNSDDYEDGQRFGRNRHQSDIDRALFHQGLKLPGNIMTQLSVGIIMTDYLGGTGEVRWQSPHGRHRFGVEASHYQHRENDSIEDAKPVIANYRYYLDRYDWALEATAGEYFFGDQGFTVTSRHWFGDTSVSVYYQDTDQSFAGLNISVPLTFRKDMAPNPVQIRGIDQWTWGYRTMVRNPQNLLDFSAVQQSDLQNNIDRNYYNRDRLSAGYINANLTRLRDAYLLYR
ncbi:YjbH domain-containing protein [Vibrio sp. WXL210]|uniref:YjbH domain-containing protein n=1 Tax=Vibrio sp. WXL210 TaxID=3450709 RepID=UPI003EC6F729